MSINNQKSWAQVTTTQCSCSCACVVCRWRASLADIKLPTSLWWIHVLVHSAHQQSAVPDGEQSGWGTCAAFLVGIIAYSGATGVERKQVTEDGDELKTLTSNSCPSLSKHLWLTPANEVKTKRPCTSRGIYFEFDIVPKIGLCMVVQAMG